MRYDNFMTSIGMHNRWHINRRQYNPECDYCKAIGMQPDFAFPLQNAPVRGPRRHDLPIAVISPGGPDGIFGRPTGGASTRTGSDTARPFFIYGLHAGDCAYRYIGTSRNPYMRLAVHKSNTRTGKGITGSNKRLYEWTTSIGADNLAMDILDGPIFSLPETIEREWCFFFHIQNYDMLNLHPERLTGWRNGPKRTEASKKSTHSRWHTARAVWNPHCAHCLEENPTGVGLTKTEGSSQAKYRI